MNDSRWQGNAFPTITLNNDTLVGQSAPRRMRSLDDAVFVIDAAGPVAGQRVFEGLGFADAFKRVPLYLFDEAVNAPQGFFVGFLPVQVIFPGMV